MIFAYIPTLNNEKTIQKSIESILAQTKKPDFFCVIDSGSTDKTAEIVKKLGVDFIGPKDFSLDFLGLGRARHIATKMAAERKCEFIFAIDSDVVAKSDWLEKTHGFIASNEYSGVGGQLIEANRVLLGDKFRAQIICCDLTKQELKYRQESNVNWLSGSQNLYKTADLLECGNFDETLKANYEDIDIANKLSKIGKKLYYLPSALAYHYQQDSLLSAIDRFYRYEATRHERGGAFKNFEQYKPRFEHLKAIVGHIHNISYECARPYFAYPAFLSVYYFLFSDVKKFVEYGRLDEATKLFNTAKTALAGLKSKLVSDAILKVCMPMVPTGLLQNEQINEEIFAWLTQMNCFDIFDTKYPAVSQHNMQSVDFETKIKVLESSFFRADFEEKNKSLIYGDFQVLLLNPTWRVEDRYGVRAGSRWPHTNKIRDELPIPAYVPFPFFMAQTLSLLRNSGIAGHFIDAIAEGYNDDECLYEAFGYRPDLIVIETSTPSFYIDLEWAKKLKTNIPSSKICFVGPHIAFEKIDTLKKHPEIDFAVYGEYEMAVLELSNALKNGNSLHTIKGLIFRDGVEIKENGRTDVVDFFALPSPERFATPFYNYNDRPIKELPYPSMQILLSRGCPYKCTFCLWPQVMFNKNYQLRDITKAIKELKDGTEIFGIKSFYVDDDTFNINKNHLRRFADELKANNIKLPWMAMARADTVVDKETISALMDSGLIALKFGIESVDEAVLDEMKKELDIKKCEEAIKLCKELGLQVHLTFSIGYLSDTSERIVKSFKWLVEQNPDSMQLSLVTPFPATNMYEAARNAGFDMEPDYTKYDGARFTVVSSHIGKETLMDVHRAWINIFVALKRGNELPLEDMKVLFFAHSKNGISEVSETEAFVQFKDWLSSCGLKN